MAPESLDTPYRGGFVGSEHRFALTRLFRGHRRLRHRLLRQLSEVHGAGAVGHDPRRRGRPGGRAQPIGQRLCGGRGRHQVSPPGAARRRSSGRQHRRTGPRILGRHSSASHARGRTVDRCPGHGRLPRRRRPAAAAAQRLGREIQGNHRAGHDEADIRYLFLLLGLGRRRPGAAAGTPAATVIAMPPLTSPDSGDKGNQMLAVGWQATQLIATDLRQTAGGDAAQAQPRRLLFLSRSHRAELLQMARRRARRRWSPASSSRARTAG